MFGLFDINPMAPVSGFNPTPMAPGFTPMADARLYGMDPMGSPFMGANPMAQMAVANEMATQALMGQLVQLLATLMGGQQGVNNALSNAGGSASGGGGSSSGGSSVTGNNASAGAVDPSQFQGGTETGRKLAAIAKSEANNGDSQGGWCLRDVARDLAKVGINVSGASAYMAADQLAKNPKVKEIKVSQGDLSKLPPGAIVVWDKGPGHPHGHISIASGNGKEFSDLERNQITNYGTSFRVFIPV